MPKPEFRGRINIEETAGAADWVFAAEQKPDAAVKMGPRETVVEGATIYYEPCLEEKLDVLKKTYADYRQQAVKPDSVSHDKLNGKKAAIINDIYNIVGGDDKELKAKLLEVADGFGGFSLPLLGTDNVIYLMLQSTTKEYLKSGGTLPNMTYDKKTDTAEYKFRFGQNTDNSSNQKLLWAVASAYLF